MKQARNFQPLLVALVLAALVAALWVLYTVWQERRIESTRQQEDKAWKRQAEELSQQIAALEAALKAGQTATASGEKAAAVFGPEATSTLSQDDAAAVAALERQVMAFFNYLDNRDYVRAYALEGGIYQHYAASMDRLSANRPQIAAESESLPATISNVFHFFRVLGRKRVELVAAILQNEPEMLEAAMRVFYRWHNAPSASLKGRVAQTVLVDYAGYLLNTLGGRSYLLRRDSKTRLLTIYYCLLVLDRANDSGLNPNGIDIRPFIPIVANDLRSLSGLMYRQSYLSDLDQLSRKYPK